jgi:hypothetical protein
MKLVEAEEVGPIEGDDALVTPPRPPHRRVSVSLIFTLSVLVGIVVAIYLLLPARHNVLVSEALERHREEAPAWDLAEPSAAELRAWAIGVAGTGVPLPAETTHVVGARRIQVLRRPAALIRIELAGEPVTYLVQHARGVAPERTDRKDGELRVVGWRRGKFRGVVVGHERSAPVWLALVP